MPERRYAQYSICTVRVQYCKVWVSQVCDCIVLRCTSIVFVYLFVGSIMEGRKEGDKVLIWKSKGEVDTSFLSFFVPCSLSSAGKYPPLVDGNSNAGPICAELLCLYSPPPPAY